MRVGSGSEGKVRKGVRGKEGKGEMRGRDECSNSFVITVAAG